MICVNFFSTSAGALIGFSIRGHAGLGEEGTDILCAAVSSAAYLIANTVTEILHADAMVEVEDGEMVLRVNRKNAGDCRTLLAGLKLHLQGLEEQYPENMQVSYLEV